VATDFSSETGKGVTGIVEGKQVAIGNLILFASLGVDPGPRRDGQSVVLIAVDRMRAGFLAIADPMKQSAAEALRALG